METTTSDVGQLGEELAADYLKNQGFEIVQRRYRYRNGEIDLVAKTATVLVFVEVKTVDLRNRKTSSFGEPESWVTPRKQKFMASAARHFLWKNPTPLDCRFDVIAVRLKKDAPLIHHLIDAFRP